MAVWYEGTEAIGCGIDRVKNSVADLGTHFVGIVKEMPGLSLVELVEEGTDFVVIRTSEGTMTRKNIVRTVEPNRVVLEYDEVYEAGSATTVSTHCADEYVRDGDGVSYHLVMSGVEGTGFLGFLYRKLGWITMGKAVLNSHRVYLEAAR